MTDPGPDQKPGAPQRTGTAADPGPVSGRPPTAEELQQRIAERVNAAYASSAPVVADDTDGAAKQSGAERFAAALAAARGKAPAPEAPATRPSTAAGTARRVRKARLRVTHVDPWSVMKTSFLLSVAIGIVTVVAVFVVWSVLGVAGVWDSIDQAVGDVVGNESSTPFRIEDYLGMSRVMGFTMIVAVVDVVLITVIATLGAFLYNLAAALLGGVELTFTEDERATAPRG